MQTLTQSSTHPHPQAHHHPSIDNQIQNLKYELQQNYKLKRFDIKSIPTYGVFRPSELEAIGHMRIRQQTFKQLINKALKLCYLYTPIIKTYYQLQNLKEINYPNPNNLLKISTLIRILYENLFYRYVVKLKIQTVDMVINLVNNRSTELNRRVIIAALIIYNSKRQSLEDIGTSLLIFNLEQALLKLRPYGLPLDQNLLQKCIKKLQRLININDLRFFIQTVKQQGEKLTEIQRQDMQYNIKMDTSSPVNICNNSTNNNTITPYGYNCQFLLGPDQFLYLTALSQKKSVMSVVFIHNIGDNQRNNSGNIGNSNQSNNSQSKKIGIESFMKQKRLQYTSSIVQSTQAQILTKNSIEVNKNNNQMGNNQDSNGNTNHGLFNNCPVREKVRGLSLYTKQSECMKKIQEQQQIYKEIKQSIKNNFQKSAPFRRIKSACIKPYMVQNQKQKYQRSNNQGVISQKQKGGQKENVGRGQLEFKNKWSRSLTNGEKITKQFAERSINSYLFTKISSTKLIKRPTSSIIFQKGLKIIQKNQKESEQLFKPSKQINGNTQTNDNNRGMIKKKSVSLFQKRKITKLQIENPKADNNKIRQRLNTESNKMPSQKMQKQINLVIKQHVLKKSISINANMNKLKNEESHCKFKNKKNQNQNQQLESQATAKKNPIFKQIDKTFHQHFSASKIKDKDYNIFAQIEPDIYVSHTSQIRSISSPYNNCQSTSSNYANTNNWHPNKSTTKVTFEQSKYRKPAIKAEMESIKGTSLTGSMNIAKRLGKMKECSSGKDDKINKQNANIDKNVCKTKNKLNRVALKQELKIKKQWAN